METPEENEEGVIKMAQYTPISPNSNRGESSHSYYTSIPSTISTNNFAELDNPSYLDVRKENKS